MSLEGFGLNNSGEITEEDGGTLEEHLKIKNKIVGRDEGIATYFKTGRVLPSRSWHSVTLTQSAQTGFMGSARGRTSVYVDGTRVWSRDDVPYLTFGSSGPSVNEIGANGDSVDGHFHGCISSIRMFDQPLDSTQAGDIHALGYDYFGSFAASEDVVQRAWEVSRRTSKSRLLDESLARSIVMGFNAGVSSGIGVSGSGCLFLNTSERPRLEAKRKRTTMRKGGRGEILTSFGHIFLHFFTTFRHSLLIFISVTFGYFGRLLFLFICDDTKIYLYICYFWLF
jgi:hypothetical protein